MLTFDVPPGSRLHGVEISELRLPGDAVVALVLRDGALFVPNADTGLRTGDHLLLVTPVDHRAAGEQRLRAVSRAGRLASWYGERRLPSA